MARRKINLRQGHSEKYVVSLRDGFKAVKCFLLMMGMSWKWMAKQTVDVIDELLCDFVQRSYDDGIARGLATAGVLYVQHALKLRHRLPAAWDALRTWATNEPSTNRVPFNEIILEAVCLILLVMGLHEVGHEKRMHFAAAITLRAGFYGLMRPGELVNVFSVI